MERNSLRKAPVRFHSFSDDKQVQLTAWYCPDLTMNLVSVGALLANNRNSIQFLFSEETCFIVIDGVAFPFATKNDSNLFELDATRFTTPLWPPQAALAVTRSLRNLDLIQLWHYRLGHANHQLVGRLLGLSVPKTLPPCFPCLAGEFKGESIGHTQRPRASSVGESLHADMHPIPKSQSGNGWALIIVDEYTRYVWGYFTPTKESSLVSQCLSHLFAHLETQFGANIKRSRSDQGREFLGPDVVNLLHNRGIRNEYSPAQDHKYNGIAERVAADIKKNARAQLAAAGLSSEEFLVAESIATAIHIHNLLPTEANKGLFGPHDYQASPYYALFRKPPRYESLHPFGCAAYIRVPPSKRDKWGAPARLGLFIGYVWDSDKIYKVMDALTKRISSRAEVIFDETYFPGPLWNRQSAPYLIPGSQHPMVPPTIPTSSPSALPPNVSPSMPATSAAVATVSSTQQPLGSRTVCINSQDLADLALKFEARRSRPALGWPPSTDGGRGSTPSILDTHAMVLTIRDGDAPPDGELFRGSCSSY